MTELPKTEQELNDLIDAKINEATEKLVAKHNGEMATMRQKHANDLAKAKEQANMSAEELAQQKIKEQQDADQQELNELRQFKKSAMLSDKLKKEGLPDFFKNDNRLLAADDTSIDKVIKDIKKEYETYQPKGATHSTVVPTQSQSNKQTASPKEQAYAQMGDVLKQIVDK